MGVDTYLSRLSWGVSKRCGLDGEVASGGSSPTNSDQRPASSRGPTPRTRPRPVDVEVGVDKEVEKQDTTFGPRTTDCLSAVAEVSCFLGWVGLIVVGLVQFPLLWYTFWEFVCGMGGNDREHMAWSRSLPLWLLWVLEVHYFRRYMRRQAPPMVYAIMTNGEVFIVVSVLMTVCTNFCTLVHTPGPRLFDVGFLIIPEQGRDSKWRPLSDTLTAVLPLIALLRSLFLERRSRCKLIADWFRLMAITYLFRCLTVTLTSLPGPAPHCESYEAYHPPANWHDIATRLGPMMGDFHTCGDLIFSGHTAWTTITMLLCVKSFRNTRAYRATKLLGALYLMAMCTLAIAGRKHYTVDITLGILLASLTFFRFQDGWQWQPPTPPPLDTGLPYYRLGHGHGPDSLPYHRIVRKNTGDDDGRCPEDSEACVGDASGGGAGSTGGSGGGGSGAGGGGGGGPSGGGGGGGATSSLTGVVGGGGGVLSGGLLLPELGKTLSSATLV